MELSTTTLPVLPLRNGVVFPHMVVTVTIETDEAARAVAATESTGGRLLLVPQVDGDFAAVGTIAEIQEVTHEDRSAALIECYAADEIRRCGSNAPNSSGSPDRFASRSPLGGSYRCPLHHAAADAIGHRGSAPSAGARPSSSTPSAPYGGRNRHVLHHAAADALPRSNVAA